MTRRRRPILCYWIHRKDDPRYPQIYLHITLRDVKSITTLIAGTIDNKAGYGSPEVAERLGRWYRYLQSIGHRFVLETPFQDTVPTIVIRYQEFHSHGYEPGYCSPEVEHIGRGQYTDIQEGAKFLKKLARQVAQLDAKRAGRDPMEEMKNISNWVLENPTRVIEALDSMGARYIQLFEGSRNEGWFHHESAWLVAQEPRPWLMTDTLAEQFNL